MRATQINSNLTVRRYVNDCGQVCVTAKAAGKLLGINDGSIRYLLKTVQLPSTRRQFGCEKHPRHLIPLDAVWRVKREREARPVIDLPLSQSPRAVAARIARAARRGKG